MNVKKICAYAVATFLILTVAFRLVAGEGFESGTVTSQMVREKAVTPEILTNTVLEQVFVSECDRITELTLLGTNYGKNVDDELRLTVLDGDGQTVASAGLNTAGLPDSSLWSIPVENSTGGHRGEMLTLQVTSVAGSTGNAVSLFYGDTVSAGKYELDIPVEHPLSVDGDTVTGQLCLSVRGESRYPLARYYWHTLAALLVLLLLFSLNTNNRLYTASAQAHRATLSYATRLASRIESCPGYTHGMPVYLIGSFPTDRVHNSVEGFAQVDHYSVPLDTVAPLNKHIYYYLRDWLNLPIEEPAEADLMAMAERPEFAAMPRYPDDGSVQIIDGCLVVKVQEEYTPKSDFEIAYENRR